MTDTAPGIPMGQPGRDDLTRACSGPVTPSSSCPHQRHAYRASRTGETGRSVRVLVFGGGHTWPGSPAAPGLADLSTQEFDAAEEICRFAEPLLASADSRRL
jgi:poly(3-hydroxybutyrate) depolymerase